MGGMILPKVPLSVNMKIILFIQSLYLGLKYGWQSLMIGIELTTYFTKMANQVKEQGSPLITNITFKNTKYVAWLGEYEHDLLKRIDEVSEERNMWRRRALGIENDS